MWWFITRFKIIYSIHHDHFNDIAVNTLGIQHSDDANGAGLDQVGGLYAKCEIDLKAKVSHQKNQAHAYGDFANFGVARRRQSFFFSKNSNALIILSQLSQNHPILANTLNWRHPIANTAGGSLNPVSVSY